MSLSLSLSNGLGSRGSSGPRIAITASRILETAVSGSTVGVLSVVGGEGIYTFTETTDPDNKFVLSGVNGANLDTNAALSFATAPSHTVTITANNGVDAPVVQTLTITVLATTVATLSEPLDFYSGTSAASLTVKTNRNNGTLFWYVTTARRGVGGFGTNNIDIKTGNGATLFGSVPVTAVGTQTVPLTGLTPGTQYYTYWLHENNSLNSNLVRAGGFVTDTLAGDARDVIEGDSITFWTDGGGGWAGLLEDANPTRPIINQALTSAVIGNSTDVPGTNSLWGRAPQTIANNPTRLAFLIGANDLAATGTVDAWFDRLYTYLDHIWTNCPNLEEVMVAGVLPQGPALAAFATNNTRRNIVNPVLRSGGGTRPGGGPRITVYIPFGDLFSDADGANDDFFPTTDGVHPNQEGRRRMFVTAGAVYNPIWAGSTAVNPNAFTLLDQNNVAPGGFGEAEMLVTGMAAGQTVSASVTGGEIARGRAGTFGAGPITVTNGDVVRVRATAPMTNGASASAVLTVGDKSDTFTVFAVPSNVVEIEHSTDGRTAADSVVGLEQRFAAVTFPTGRPAIIVSKSGNNESLVTINGVEADPLGGFDAGTQHRVWMAPPSQVLTAGTYEVRVTSPNTLTWVNIAPFAIRNCAQEVSAMTVRKLPRTGTYTSRYVRTSPVTAVPNGGQALYAFNGVPTSLVNFIEGETVFQYAANPNDSNRRFILGKGGVSGELGWNQINSSVGGSMVVAALEYTIDVTPDAFTFTDQTGVAPSTVIESNTITVTGIAAASLISITGGEYAIDTGSGFGAWTSAPGTVDDGDQVKVRHTSSADFLGNTSTTLTIGGVSDTFMSTTQAEGGGTDNVLMSASMEPGFTIMNGNVVPVLGGAYKESE